LPYASKLEEVDKTFRKVLTNEGIASIVSLIPDEWLIEDPNESPENKRNVYKRFLEMRLAASDIFVKEANNARQALI